MNYDKSVEYFGHYRGIGWSIRESEGYKSSPWKTHWCHYIHINLNQLPERREEFWLTGISEKFSEKSKRNWINYRYTDSILSSLEWHHGCTFYSKTGGFDGGDRMIKAGCDYQHSWDEGQEYYLERVFLGVRGTIDSLHELIPNIGIFCRIGYCENPYCLESQGKYNEDKSSFRCLECEKRL